MRSISCLTQIFVASWAFPVFQHFLSRSSFPSLLPLLLPSISPPAPTPSPFPSISPPAPVSSLLLLPPRMPKAGVAGQDASVGPARLARAPTRSSQTPQTATEGSRALWWPKRRGAGERQGVIRAWWNEVGSGVIRCRCARGGPRYSAYRHPSPIGPAAECRDPLCLLFLLRWQLLGGRSDLSSCLRFLQRSEEHTSELQSPA